MEHIDGLLGGVMEDHDAIRSESVPPIPQLSYARYASGDFGKAWIAIRASETSPAKKLDLLARQIGYSIRPHEYEIALGILKALPQGNQTTVVEGRITSISSHIYDPEQLGRIFAGRPELSAFAAEIALRWQFKDKYTKRWWIVYALVTQDHDGSCLAEIAVTDKPLGVLANLFAEASQVRRRTVKGRFLLECVARRSDCHLVWLESVAGDLDQAGAIKHQWQAAATAARVVTPQRTYQHGWSPNGRHWPQDHTAQSVTFRVPLERLMD